MKCSLLILVLSISLANGFDYLKRCLYFNNSCVNICPRYMYPYHTRCDRDTMSQRTCASPHKEPIGFTCGWSRCDCNGDMVLDEETMSCVQLGDCSDPAIKRARRRRIRKKKKASKRVHIRDEDKDLVDL